MKNIILLFLCMHSAPYINAQNVTCPPNIDFELGNLNNWQFYIGTCCPVNANTPTAPLANRHTITSGAGIDPYGLFPIVSPGGGSYSLKLGNSGTGAQAERARYTFTVPIGLNNYSLIYKYAVVFEDPQHSPADQPRFVVKVFNAVTNQTLPCADYTYVAAANLPGFQTSNFGNNVRFKSWATASINLSGYAGQTLVAEFSSGDCALSGHFGYGYVDLSCGLFQIVGVNCNNDPFTNLNAPPGFAQYLWYDSTYATLIGTGQNIVINTPPQNTLYNLVILPYVGFGCPDTLQTVVTISNFNLFASNDTTVCESDSVQLNASVIGNANNYTYTWSPNQNISCINCPNPVVYAAATQAYIVTATDMYGCSKSDTININVIPTTDSIINQTICEADSFLGYYMTGTYIDTFVNANGCDSIRTLNLVVNPNTYNTINQTICEADTFLGYFLSGTYLDTFTNASGCDSVRTINLIVNPITYNIINQTICEPTVYLGYAVNGTYIDTLINANGCDSIRTLNLVVNPITYSTLNNTICEPNTFLGYNTSGIYIDTLINANGCDSIRTLNLLVNPITYETLNQTICQPGTFLGYSVSGTYIDTLVNATGCDSIRTLNLIVNPITYSTVNQTICESDTFLGYYLTGTYIDSILNVNGCDSIRTLNLVVNPITFSTISNTICEPNTFLGYNTTGIYTDTLINIYGCDSVRTLNLIVNPITYQTLNQTICEPAYFLGYSGSGTYVDTLTNANGCDSIRTLNLIVNPITYSTVNQNICESDTFLGYYLSGTYIDSILNMNGCDSIRTLNLVVNPITYSTLSDTICEPNTYLGYSTSGTYIDTLLNNNGCDSIRTLNLLVNPITYNTINQTICEPDSFLGYSSNGTYVDVLINAKGCDSIRTLNLIVNPITYSNFTDTICFGENFLGYSQTGIFTDTFINHAGCDSVRVIDLFVDEIKIEIDLKEIYCRNESNGKIIVQAFGGIGGYKYQLRPGLQLNTSGIFGDLHQGTYSLTIKDSYGCQLDTMLNIGTIDSILTVHINKKDLPCYGTGYDGWADVYVFGGKPPYTYIWNTSPIQTTKKIDSLRYGYYNLKVIDANGCELVDTVYIEPSICCDEVFIPNAFSPNGDGLNDIFKVTTTAGLELYQWAVYNRWGNKVWSSTDYFEGWDGKFREKDQPLETYFYIFSYKCLATGEDILLKGDVTLVR
ncbi:MAG: gliding motility-associated C-terminal domain-containing protein [Bacteroidetes bacterium]|nr:gliding motility-associated C-terminal domain-containing protein [Bacteroidota bacterium]